MHRVFNSGKQFLSKNGTYSHNKDWVRVIRKFYFACFGCRKLEEEGDCGCEINIQDAECKGNPNLFLSLPSKQYPHPSPHHPQVHGSYKKEFQKIDKFGKNIYMLVTYSFLTQVTDLFLILTYIVLMTHTQFFSISCFDCQSILWIVKAHAIKRNKSQHCCVVGGFWPTMLHPFAWAWKFDQFQTTCNRYQQVPTLLWYLWGFFCNPKISWRLSKTQKITFGQNFRPKNITRTPLSLKYMWEGPWGCCYVISIH